LFDGETFGWFDGYTSACFGFGGFEKRGSFDEGVPFVASRTLPCPFGELVAAAVTKKDGSRSGHEVIVMYVQKYGEIKKMKEFALWGKISKKFVGTLIIGNRRKEHENL